MTATSPLVIVARSLVGRVVHVFANGGHRFTGQLVKVAEDGQAVRLTNQPYPGVEPINFYIDLVHVVAISLKGEPTDA